jgi:hypothetical protein
VRVLPSAAQQKHHTLQWSQFTNGKMPSSHSMRRLQHKQYLHPTRRYFLTSSVEFKSGSLFQGDTRAFPAFAGQACVAGVMSGRMS